MTEIIKQRFYKLLASLKGFDRSVDSLEKNVIINNEKLRKAASRIQVPRPFYPYIGYMESNLGIKFPTDLQYTIEEVTKADLSCFDRFSSSNFQFSGINLDLLLRSSIISAQELGIIKLDGSKHATIPLEEAVTTFQLGTSSSYPLFLKKGSSEAQEDALAWSNNFMQNPSLCNIMKQATAIFHRFQYKYNLIDNTLTKKVRQVFGISYRVLCVEAYFFRNMVNYCTFKNSTGFPYATWGNTNPRLSRDLLPHLRSFKKRIICLDMKQYDSTVPSYFWSLFFSVSSLSILMSDKDVKPFELLMIFLNFTPYCYKSTRLRYQRRGTPSGALTTSLFNSFVNRTIINYAFLEYNKGKISAGTRASVLGDDNIIVEDCISYQHILNVYTRFGLIVNTEKSGVFEFDKDVEFLGVIWDYQNRPYQKDPWYISHLAMPSRFYRDTDIPIPYLQTCRGITICMVLYKGIETFERMIGDLDYVWKDIKYRYYELGEDPLITWISEDQTLTGTKIPMSKIITEGWLAFG